MLVIDAVLPVILEQFCTFVATESQLVTGVGGDVKWLQEELQSMNFLLRAASRCAEEENCDPRWIDQIRDVMHEAEDVIEIFGLLESRPHRCYSIPSLVAQIKIRFRVGLKIKNIRTNLADISRRKSEYPIPEATGTAVDDSSELLVKRLASSPLICDGVLVGAEEHLALIMSQTVEIVEDLSVISVLGMGGIGKTTIVKHIYNSTIIKKHFDRSAWIYVSQSVSNRQILSRMLNGLMEIPTAETTIADDMSLQDKLLTGLNDKRYLLVLDDMWNKELWDVVKLVLPKGKHGSKVIITTRNLEIASLSTKTSHIHQIHPLSEQQSWKLFCMKASGAGEPPEELTEFEKQIVKKCAGLPLAVITLREMMSRKDRTQAEWKDVLKEVPMGYDSIDESIRQVLLLSYKDLSYPLKQCFLYLAAFPPNFEFSRKRLVQLLMAEGFIYQEQEKQPLEDVAERYLMDLISRNMLQISKRSTSGRVKACRVHDLIHQLAISLSEKEKLITIYRNTDSSLQRTTRRVSIQDVLYGKLKLHKLRSILIFKNINSFYHLTHDLFKTNRMLRVLDLEESGIKKLPNKIGSTLCHLRYLNVKGTQIDRLPKSIENLFKLQTLDIRRTLIRKVTLMMNGLKQLQHLQMGDIDQSILISPGLDCLGRLQVLTGIQATESVIKDIANMCQLRKLIVEVKQAIILKIMCPSINNMKALLSLSIICKEFRQMDLTALVPPPLLQKLHLAGCLEKLPSWIINTHNLVKVRLGFSQLREDPMPPLGVLPNLVFLQLYDAAYQGKKMRCISNGFSKLKIMILTQLNELENWEIEVGALSSIQEVWIMSCTHLNMIPTGFQFLRSMMKLRVVHMPLDFQMRFLTPEGVDFLKVQHIPAIQVLN